MKNHQSSGDSERPLILIVDDRPKNLQVLVNILRKENFKVAVATSGEQALSIVEEHNPELILLDIIMPDMDGIEICKELKKSPNTERIPIIFLTGKTGTEDVVSGFKAGAVDYVTKPFNSIEVLSRVNTQIEMKRNRDMILQINEKLRSEVRERTRVAEELKKKNEILDKMAVTDGLTGLFNHKFIHERLSLEVAEAKRYTFDMSIIIFDIDHFKKINDTYGHLVGDEVLVAISAAIKDQLRKVDLVGRSGGEEFLVICPHTNLDGIIITAERIRKRIESLKYKDPDITVTISGGCCLLKGETDTELLKKADTLLYQAKQKGRNRIEYGLPGV